MARKGVKRKAFPNLSTPSKRVRIGSATDISDQLTTSPTGRPKRASVSEPNYDDTTRRSSGTQITTGDTRKTESGVKRRRRLPQAAVSSAPVVESDVTPRKRGRPRKNVISPAPFHTQQDETEPRKRGRPRNNATSAKIPPPATTTVPAKRGRPPKAKAEVAETTLDSETDLEDPRRRNGGALTTANGDENLIEDLARIDTDVQYWLMKAEPDSRIEKGHDVKFSIDDLAARTEPEAWDGVRNAAARNNMRAMRKGDLAFFYHSNCTVPGVAGVMRIVGEHSVDESAFDPEHPYFDVKSDRANPKWEVVHVEFVKKFEEMVTLKELKSFAKDGGALAAMQMIKQSRLSVSSVTPTEWRFILDLAGEPVTLGHGDGMSGYESEIDGEGEETAGVSDADGITGLSDDGIDFRLTSETAPEGPATVGGFTVTSTDLADDSRTF